MWYTLGDYTLDTQRYELYRVGILLKLQPKVFELLAYLIQHRDRVVTRQELFDTLWPEQFVSDDALEPRPGLLLCGAGRGTFPRSAW
jgi:DNA-binding winged helix-turn-helix (wHTH) protein